MMLQKLGYPEELSIWVDNRINKELKGILENSGRKNGLVRKLRNALLC